ncbi:tRNA (cytosine(34)-C(5))-methyltransferase [Toxorhynchites rutilus septentrionalis]|uniref:tRNA (cytosine(34)-C(5))-methyltransferase n=1 Tax=Toxorhynchites rutilus septentrionalis TaxID=329112 RepID=UPI002479EB6C|nr:tRNA (cytosine(34)-C(5))-methyltransferase [Toxorhynchites rutilus septentrionalis]
MGKNKRSNKQNPFARKKRELKEKGAEPDRRDKPYEDIVRENENFEVYYKHQNICKPDEWDEFMGKLRSNLPTTFRITGSKGQARTLLKIIKDKFFTEYYRAVTEFKEKGEKIPEPKCLSWYPNEFAWQLDLSRKDIRRSEPLYRLHNFLIAETSSGNISRQEAVSMIPPLVLGVEPHHKVLDMCAAPGSKTAQLIEALHAGGESLPSGFVLANDIDNNRCYMLVHQAKRLSSACCLVTNADSTAFPSMKLKNDTGELTTLKFDRVLCDVPCSGDGTLRKNPDIWNKWNLGHATNLHGLQYRIVKRGAELLEVGGKLVYSTCSLNPIENEAVLHYLLAQAGDALEIVDASHLLPTLKYNPGLTYWELASKDMKFYKSFDEVPGVYHTVIRPQMFPPAPEDADKFNLTRCIRVMPHHQNTGGFFIALIEKKKKLPWESNESDVPAQKESSNDSVSEPPKKKMKYHRGFKEDPFVFFDGTEEIFESIKKFYCLSEDFKAINLLTRCKEGKKKNIYFCSDIVRNVLTTNEEQIKFINLGVKSFARCDNRNMDCDFRLAQEGLESVNGFIGQERRIHIEKDDLIQLLSNNDPTKPPEISSLSEVTQKNVEDFAPGSCILEYRGDDLELNLVGWRGTRSLRAYVDQHDTVHMLRLLGADVSKYEKNKFEEKKEASETATETSSIS